MLCTPRPLSRFGNRRNLLAGVSVVALAAGGTLPARPALAAATAYVGPTTDANWSTTNNWTAGAPTIGSSTTVNNGHVVTTDGSDSTDTLTVGSTAGSGVNVAAFTTLSVSSAIANAGQINLNGGLLLGGNVALSGGGTLTMTGQIGTDGTLRTLTNSTIIQGSGVIGSNAGALYQNLSLTNSGTINANTAANGLTIGGTGSAVVNTGLFEATAGGTLLLASNAPVTNTGGTILATGSGSTVTVNTAILGGTLTTANAGAIGTGANGAVLNGAAGAGAITISPGSTYTATAGLTSTTGTLNFGTGSSLALGDQLRLIGDTTLNGPGVVNISGGGQIGTDSTPRTLINNTIIQGSGVIGSNAGALYQTLGLTNNGTITANTNGQTLSIQATGSFIVNANTFAASNGGTLNLQTSQPIVNQAGTISATGAGSIVTVNGTTIQGGTLSTSGGGVIQTAGSSTLDGLTFYAISISPGTTFIANTGLMSTRGTLNFGAGSSLELGDQLKLIGDTTLTGAGVVNISGNAAASTGGQIGTNGTAYTLTNQAIIQGTGLLGSNAGSLYNNGSLNNQGTIRAAGGTLTIAETGGATNSGTFNSGAGSTLNVVSSLTNFAGGTLTGGTYRADAGSTINLKTAGITTNAATILLNGAGSAIITQAGAIETTLATNAQGGSLQILGGRNYGTALDLGNSGAIQLGGGTLAPLSLTNATTGSITGFGTVAPSNGTALANAGTVTADGGTLTLATGITGTGTLQINAGATASLAGAPASNTVGVLAQNGTLATAGHNVTVSSDYTNANFGTGNAFNKTAGVTGGGQILGAGNVAQAITGAKVQNGATTTPTLALGDYHTADAAHATGGTSATFAVANTGTTGPALRGALQNTGVTDTRLSGSGVTAGNFGPIAPGAQTSPYTVTVAPAGSGALVNQSIHIANNFANVAEQTLAITGTGYNYAQATIANGLPINLGNVRVGTTATTTLGIGNTAPTGAFTEKLDGSASGSTGNATVSGGFTGLAAGSSSNAISVGLSTSTAGAKSGTVTVGFTSNAAGVDSLGNSALPSQTVQVQGAAFRLATGSASTPVSTGNVHVGDAAQATVAITNTAAADGFSEKLNAAVGGVAGNVVSTSGSVALLGAGATSTAITARLDTSTAGAKSGTVGLNYASDGTGTTGQAATANGNGTVTVAGNVYNLASSSTIGNVNLGVLHTNTGTQTRAVSVTNTAAAGSFSEGLDTNFGTATSTGTVAFNASGAITNLAAGATDATSLQLSVSTAKAGIVSGTIQVHQASNGTVSGLGSTALPDQNPSVSGTVAATVTNLAQAQINTAQPVAFGNVRIGSTQSTSLSITNAAPVGGFSESLVANTAGGGAGTTGGVTLAGGFGNGSGTAVPSLAPQATDATHVTVGLNTATAGAKSGNATINFKSDGTGFTGGTVTDLGTQNVAVTGNVFRLANPSAITPAVTLAARVGGTASTALSVGNSSPDIYTEGLKASLAAAPSNFTSTGAITNLAAGGTDTSSLRVGLVTSTAGTFTGNQAVTLASTGAGTTGAADQALASGTVALTGKVYQTASASVTPVPVNFGTVHVGDTVAALALTIGNTAPGALTDVLQGGFGAVSGPFTGTGTLGAGVAAGATSTAMKIGLNTSSAGVFSGSAGLALTSHDSDLADIGVAAGPVSLGATVNNYAVSGFGRSGGAGSFSGLGNSYTLDFGTVATGTSLMDTLFAANFAVGPADVLAGTFSSGGGGFGLSGFSSFSGLVAGAQFAGLTVTFNAGSPGTFKEVVDLIGTGSNGSGYSGAVADTLLTIEGTVAGSGTPVPEPGTLALLGSGLAAMLSLRRRKLRVA